MIVNIFTDLLDINSILQQEKMKFYYHKQ